MWLALLFACADPPGSAPPTCVPDGTGATVDGVPWSTTATWMVAGSSVQVNLAPADGWRMTAVLQRTADGTAAAEVALPASFDLSGEDAGGWVLVYPDEGDSYTSQDGVAGTLELVDLDGERGGCFAFEAVGADGTISVDAGSFEASAAR